MNDKPLEDLAAAMREQALTNPFRHIAGEIAGIESGAFRRLVRINQTRLLSVILTVSPNDAETALFWHVSAAIISADSQKPVSRLLWTKNEKKGIKNFLRRMLGDAGIPATDIFRQQATTVHLHRDLNLEERGRLRVQTETDGT